ncbi:MAG TPA: hypothetical protein VHC19_03830 [Pirellulales bacterium]|nr:hypothetical protein [Pirellulales bacterium]
MESEVYQPARRLALVVGGCFLLLGVIGLASAGGMAPPGAPLWPLRFGAGAFALFGALPVLWSIRNLVAPIRVSHAPLDSLPGIPAEPVVQEGWVVHGRVTHELVESPEAWQFRPARNPWRNDKRFLLGFGIPFVTAFAGLLSWVIHDRGNQVGWPLSIIGGIAVTLVCGGSALALIGMLQRASYRRLCRLTIPAEGRELELDAPAIPGADEMDFAAGLQWAFLGETKRRRLTIPRELIAAVQLCPWKFAVAGSGGQSVTWAVQGLLVLSSSAEAGCYRLPILLTSDFVGAAWLMPRLAETLDVPYLFCAGREDWKAEEQRANQRPPLKVGGIQS